MATRKKPRTAAQKAATKRMIAANKAKRSGRSPPARSAPKRKSPKRTTARVAPARSPKRRTKRKSWAITPTKVASRAGRQLRYRRRNPIGGIGSFVMGTAMPSVVGGAGALTLDVLMGVLPLPDKLKTGPMRPVVKIAGAIGIGMLAKTMVSRRTAEQITAGALTVTLYDLARSQLSKMLTNAGIKVPGLSEYVSDADVIEMSMYPDDNYNQTPALGYEDSGMQVGGDDGMGEYVEGYETGVYR